MIEQRLLHLQKWLIEEDISYAFIQGQANVFYFSGFRCHPYERIVSLLVFPDHEPCLVCPNMEKALVRQAGWSSDIIGYNDHEDPWELLSQYLSSLHLQGTNLAIEKESLFYARAEQLQKLSPDLSFMSIDAKLMEQRLIKSEAEISILREAAKLADFGIEVGVHALQTGRTEMDILALIEYELKRKGITEMSFGTLVLSGEQLANPHGSSSMKQIHPGEFVLFDLGVVLEGYCSDMTRTVAFGDISEEQKNIYHTVLQAQLKTLDLCKKGTVLGDLDKTARKIITDAGYGKFFPHRIGHGLGSEVHELPSLNEKNKEQLKVGMTFTIEPGIYVPNVGGVRIEDEVLITDQGYECLTTYPKELQIIK